MKKFVWLFLILLSTVLYAQSVTLENASMEVKISKNGGTITSFKLKSMDLNPIHSYGHFICFDRWGPSTPEDQALGIPWHGEGSSTPWTVDQSPIERSNFIYTEMSCQLPIVKLGLDRKIYLDKSASVMRVIETVSNHNDSTRYFNLVQHATIGTPFLDETTIVNTHVLQGFDQDGNIPPAEEDIMGWPDIVIDGDSLDTRYLDGDIWPQQTVFSYILHEETEFGWITAVNASKQLMIGYVWPTAEYPWLNLWQRFNSGQPFARGFEFGSTGLHQPWPTILETGTIFDHQLLEYIAPNETVKKSYIAFLAEIPNDYQGVESIEYIGNSIIIQEVGQDPERTITIDMEAINTSIEESQDNTKAPSMYNLTQNYPNPFNASTRIEYTLPESGHVELSLFNIKGQKIKTLVNAEQPKNSHVIDVPGDELSSGIYFCQLRVNHNPVHVIKLIHQK